MALYRPCTGPFVPSTTLFSVLMIQGTRLTYAQFSTYLWTFYVRACPFQGIFYWTYNHIIPSGSALPKTKFETASLDMNLTGFIDLYGTLEICLMGGGGGGLLVGGLCFVRYFANASPYLGQVFLCRVKPQDGGHCQNKWPLRLKAKGPLFLECPQPRSFTWHKNHCSKFFNKKLL